MKCRLTSQSANGLQGEKYNIMRSSTITKMESDEWRKSWLRSRRRTDSQRGHLNLQQNWQVRGEQRGHGKDGPAKPSWSKCVMRGVTDSCVSTCCPVTSPRHLASVLPLGSPPSCHENCSPRLHRRSTVLKSLMSNEAVPAVAALWSPSRGQCPRPAGQHG